MRIRSFDYHTCCDIQEALHLLAKYGPDAKVLAGGTDLVLALKAKTIRPPHVLNIIDIPNLDYIRNSGGTIRIGTLARHAQVSSDPLLREHVPALADAAGLIGSWQLRNVGTIGGNLCNASPSADSAPPLLAADAEAVLMGPEGEHQVPLREFFVGPRTTRLQPTQLLKEVVIPVRGTAPRHSVYLKLKRKKAVDLALVGVCVQAQLDKGANTLNNVAIALGGVAPTPIRVVEAEKMLLGAPLEQAIDMLPDAANAAVAATSPITDVRATAEYRREMVRVFVQRAGRQVFEHLASKVRDQ